VFTVGVCDDEPAIRSALVRGLSHAGHDALIAHNGREAVSLMGPGRALDVIIMDIGLPDADGRDVVQALRAAGQNAPVLFLTALGTITDKLSGFAAGGDDYVVKPFEIREIIARVQALAARAASDRADTSELHLDPITFTITTPHGQAVLAPTEFRVLAAIMAGRGEVIRRSAVLAAAWPDGAYVAHNTLDSYIRRVRIKLAQAGSQSTLQTIRGVGFRIR
jgi:two-component system response regulator MprA